jgi:hypothetical protein
MGPGFRGKPLLLVHGLVRKSASAVDSLSLSLSHFAVWLGSNYMKELEEKATRSTSILVASLMAREEKTIAVFCHWGVIRQLTGMELQNCDVLELSVTGGEAAGTWAIQDSTYIPRLPLSSSGPASPSTNEK